MPAANPGKANYLRFWHDLFEKAMGWSGAEVDAWVRQSGYDQALSDRGSMIYHRPPQYWAVEQLLRQPSFDTLSKIEKVQLGHRLLRTLPEENVLPAPPQTINWQSVRANMDTELQKLGLSLDQPPVSAQAISAGKASLSR